MNCPYCGGNMSSGVKNCPNCGAAVESASENTAYSAPAQNFTSSTNDFAGSGELASPKHVNFLEAIKLYFMNYAKFDGRSTRSEYWWVVLFNFIVGFVLGLVGLSIVAGVYSLATLVPGIAIGIRRLHDTGRSGWWLLLAITGIGAIVLIIWYAQDSVAQNQWGSSASELGR